MSFGPPVLVAFLPGSLLRRGRALVSPLPIVRNGPPGTFVDLPIRVRVSLPTDQIVAVEESEGGVRVGFGGMRFDGIESDGLLTFHRVREVQPEHDLSPERGRVMKLRPEHVAAIEVEGRRVWPPADPPAAARA